MPSDMADKVGRAEEILELIGDDEDLARLVHYALSARLRLSSDGR